MKRSLARMSEMPPGTPVCDFALAFFKAGFSVIPVSRGKKITAVKWDPWLENLCERKIREHFEKHPEHELGAIVSGAFIVLDADTPESLAALYNLEEQFELASNFIVETRRGEHHYFRCTADTIAKTYAADTSKFPRAIDIKAGRSLVVLPPSTDKSILVCEIDHAKELTEIGQIFVDAVYRHNGRPPPIQPALIRPPPSKVGEQSEALAKLNKLLAVLDPNIGYSDWVRVGMGISHETGNSDQGFDLFDDWSSRGKTYPGREPLARKWSSFAGGSHTPVTLGTLWKLAEEAGNDPAAILENTTAFTKVPMVTVDTQGETETPPSSTNGAFFKNPLRQFALNGQSDELARQLRDEVFVLDPVALLGQATMLYGPANAGKTLLVLVLLIDAIVEGRIQPEKIFYINSDDALRGLVEKVRIAEKSGFMMVADGYRGFVNRNLLKYIGQIDDPAAAAGVVIVIDTVKKFTDLMSKKESSSFASGIRRFISKGGTVIGLGHVNKQRGSNDKLMYAGTTDIVDDFDCSYIIDVIESGDSSGKRVVEFENIKSRGSVAPKIAFSYLHPSSVTCYRDMLDSVARIPNEEAHRIATSARLSTDAPLIDIVKSCIRNGRTAKKDLIAALRQQGELSRAKAADFIERYNGDDPALHLWRFSRGAFGAHSYSLLSDEDQPAPGGYIDF